MVGLLVGLGLAKALAWQTAVHLGQVAERRINYEAALEAARTRGKPLLVVGGPLGANPLRRFFPLPAHGCGDVCVDIEAGACAHCPLFIEADVRDLSIFPDGKFGAAFCSHVLEHLPTIEDARKAAAELQRVADEVYIVCPRKSSLLAWLIPDHHLWVSVENGEISAEQRG